MSEVRRLTKSDLIQGKNKVHYIFFEEVDGEIALKPLTDGQYAEVESIRLKGTKLSAKPKDPTKRVKEADDAEMSVDIDLVEITKAEYEADVLAVTYAMADGDNWSIQDVRNIGTVGLVKKIAGKVYDITGVTPGQEDFLSNFRK